VLKRYGAGAERLEEMDEPERSALGIHTDNRRSKNDYAQGG
jgi:hypothetical protein